jgi:hypothetical protein
MIGGMKYSGERSFIRISKLFAVLHLKSPATIRLVLALSHINGFNFDSADFV